MNFRYTYLVTARYARCKEVQQQRSSTRPCLLWASFAMVPQVWFRVFISSSSVHRQVFFGLPSNLVPRVGGCQCRAVLVMLPGSFLLSSCLVHLHLLLMMMVSIQSWRQRASSCSFEMLLGQKILKIHLRIFVWKTESLLRSLAVILQHSEPYNKRESTQLWYSFSLVYVNFCWDLQKLLRILKVFPALLRRVFTSLPAPPSHLKVLPQ